jgi:hypothetical protein
MTPERRDRAVRKGKVMQHPSRARRTAALLALTAALCAAFLVGSPAAEATTAAAPRLITTINGAQIWHSTENYSYKCPVDRICIWTGTGFTGYGIFYPRADIGCHGWRFEGSVWQDHTYSIWNRTTGAITIWDRAMTVPTTTRSTPTSSTTTSGAARRSATSWTVGCTT